MNEIQAQVSRARRRLVLARFLSIFQWACFASLVVALVGLAIPKIWHLGWLEAGTNRELWNYGWLAGSLAAAVIVTLVQTWLGRPSALHAAVEVDHRFGLKERLSSAIALSDDDAQSPAGESLMQDAQSRAEGIDIGEHFSFRPRWTALLPVVPLLLMAALVLIPDAEKRAVAAEPDRIDREKIKIEVEEFKKKLEEKRQQLEATGLKDAAEDLKSLAKKFDKLLDDKQLDKKETLIKLNDIKKEIESRREELGDSKEFKQQLNRLKEVSSGPAKKLSKALKDGDFEQAKDEALKLADQLAKGDIKPEEMKRLAEDLNNLAEQLQKAAQEQEQKKQDLEQQIQQAVKQGDLDKAAKLQEKLDQMKQNDQQQQQMQQMAQNLKKCAECMNPGQNGGQQPGQQGNPQAADEAMQQAMKQAGQDLQAMAEQLKEMQQQMQQMEALEDLQQGAEACKQAAQGNNPAPNQGQPQWKDWAKGAGQGAGKREIADDDTGQFKARVKGDVKQGETVVTGSADGKNISGRSTTETRKLIQASMDQDVDPLENQKLSKKQREHAEQYFRALRENQ